MKQLTLLIMGIFMSTISFASNDSLPSLPKNRINVGLTSINFLDGKDFNFNQLAADGYRYLGLSAFEYSKLIKNKYLITFGYNRYARGYYLGNQVFNLEAGGLVSKFAELYSLSVGLNYEKNLNRHFKLVFVPKLSAMYRSGLGDELFFKDQPNFD